MSDRIRVSVDGRPVLASPPASILQAASADGSALTANVGCYGQGVCGACRCMVRKEGEREIRTVLACETPAEDGMQVSFIDYFTPARPHAYDIAAISDLWRLSEAVETIFPEARQCRHCSGCDRACPKGLAVQKGVALAVAGDFAGVSEIFDPCVMCNLCTLACPERIWPNHLGLMVRRAVAVATLRPSDLIRRLTEISQGAQEIDMPGAPPAAAAEKG